MAGLRIGRVPARRTARDNHPVGGAAYRRDLVRRSVPDSHYVNVSRHPTKVAGSLGRVVLPPLSPGAPIGQHAPLALPVVGKPVRSLVGNHRAPLRVRSWSDIPDRCALGQGSSPSASKP